MNRTDTFMRGMLATMLLLIAAVPLTAFAQDDAEVPEGWEEFTSQDEVFTVQYPEGWAANDEEPLTLVVANSEDLLERLTNDNDDDDDAIEGDQALLFLTLPAELMAIMGMVSEDGMAPDEFSQAVATFFAEGDDDAEDAPTFGEALVLELDDETSVGAVQMAMENSDVEGYFIADDQDGVVVIAFVLAKQGEFEDFEETALQIFRSFTVNISSEELMSMMTGEG